eukprot:scaffold18042_cov65-Phaeocystis_antarctica.AAC.1
MFGHTKAIVALTAAGAKMNTQVPRTGSLPLHTAASRGDLEAVEALLAAGAQVDGRTKSGLTPLDLAVFLGKTEVAEALMAAGASSTGTQPLLGAPVEVKKIVPRIGDVDSTTSFASMVNVSSW